MFFSITPLATKTAGFKRRLISRFGSRGICGWSCLLVYALVLWQGLNPLADAARAHWPQALTHAAAIAAPATEEAPASGIAFGILDETRIAPPVRRCVHHQQACPPDCHCPPLADPAGQDLADLAPGDKAWQSCQSLPLQAPGLGDLPPHAPGVTSVLPVPEAPLAFPEAAASAWASVDRPAPDKVPILPDA